MKQQPVLVDRHGQEINADSAHAAASWLTLLMSDEISEQDKIDWQQWRAESADNERAWCHIESICAGFNRINGKLAHQSLSPFSAPTTTNRRTLLKVLATLSLTAGGLGLGSQSQGWQALTADYHTATGEQRHVRLSEGTQLILDTQTALNVRYDAQQRQIELISGDLLITSGEQEKKSAFPRPLTVLTPHGRVLALGTRFRVQLQEDQTEVQVYQGAVRLYPRDSVQVSPTLKAGQGAWLNSDQYGGLHNGVQEPAWVHGQLLADNMRLGDFLRALNRYRPGVLRCDENIAQLRLSGVFPLADTDRILAALPSILPIKINSLSRYWISLSRQ